MEAKEWMKVNGRYINNGGIEHYNPVFTDMEDYAKYIVECELKKIHSRKNTIENAEKFLDELSDNFVADGSTKQPIDSLSLIFWSEVLLQYGEQVYGYNNDLPTDEEIEKKAKEYFHDLYSDGFDVTLTIEKFADGAKWIRSLINGEKFEPFKRQ